MNSRDSWIDIFLIDVFILSSIGLNVYVANRIFRRSLWLNAFCLVVLGFPAALQAYSMLADSKPYFVIRSLDSIALSALVGSILPILAWRVKSRSESEKNGTRDDYPRQGEGRNVPP
jgi:hypothetical protein